MAPSRAAAHIGLMESTNVAPSFHPPLPQFTAASIEEIRYAEALRRQIEQRYLGASGQPHDPYWSVGAD